MVFTIEKVLFSKQGLQSFNTSLSDCFHVIFESRIPEIQGILIHWLGGK